MKKLSLFIVAILFVVACSTDNPESDVTSGTINPSTKKGGVELDKLYSDMVKSESYINFKAASAEFAKKMKFTGNVNSVNTDEKILAWVNENISKTGFNSYVEAAEEFATVKRLGQLAVNNNFSFYEGLEGQGPGRIIEIFEPEYVAYGCKECQQVFIQTVTTLSNEYANSIGNAIGGFFAGTMSGEQVSNQIRNAQVAFQIGSTLASEELVNCCISGGGK